MPRKTRSNVPDPADTITNRVMELTRSIHDAESEIRDFETFLYGHEGPPREVLGITHEIGNLDLVITEDEKRIGDIQTNIARNRKTLAEMRARKDSAEAKIAELRSQIENDQGAVKSIIRDNIKTP